VSLVLVLLPPSEGKASARRGRPLDLAALSCPTLGAVRLRLLTALQQLARTEPARLRLALGLSPRQTGEIALDAALTKAPTLPTMRLYTGVLYEALGYATLPAPARRRANSSLLVASALFGLVRPSDRLPPYRLSGGTVLPGLGGLAPLWRPVLEPELAHVSGLVVDLRSGTYAALARVPGAVEVRVLRETGGRRTVVSHDNKYTKGLLARALCEHGARTVSDVAEAGRSVSDLVEVDGNRVDLVLRGLATARPQIGNPGVNAASAFVG
jgi:cytoplasmic iron level regulating protein YaaA (DUF328/UPF0246 family)